MNFIEDILIAPESRYLLDKRKGKLQYSHLSFDSKKANIKSF